MQFVDIVVGGQYGSEAKGHVTAQLVKSAHASLDHAEVTGSVINVRVAGPNAGHTAYDERGQKFAFRSLPIGAVIDKRTLLYIAPGSEVDIEVLLSEINLAAKHGHETYHRLFVSREATVITDRHKREEAELVGKVGSTGKGIGAARADRIMRNATRIGDYYGDTASENVPWTWAEPEDLYATDQHAHEENIHVIIEGTQGYGLSMRASGHYPQVTSSDCRAIDFLAMAGLDPTRCGVSTQTWVVARVFPIRVAGNSGPIEGETSWAALDLPEEHTTVTQKVRRVGTWDFDLVKRAIQANGGHNAMLIITMMDQIVPGLADYAGKERNDDMFESEAFVAAQKWIEENTDGIGADVGGITFSPTDIVWTQHADKRFNGGEDEGPAQDALAMLQKLLGGSPTAEDPQDQGRAL